MFGRKCLIVALPLLFISIGVLLLTACAPGWLPDSSGFVFVRKEGQVAFFDLKKKTTRDIGEVSAPMARPAISPDGKQIGVLSAGGGSLRVSLFDLSGKHTHTSPDFKPDKKTLKTLESNGTGNLAFDRFMSGYWSPDGKRLVFVLPNETAGMLVYEVASRKFRHLPELLPVSALTAMLFEKNRVAFNASPFSPDSKGLLACRISGSTGPKFEYYTWKDEKPSELKMTSAVKDGQQNRGTVGVSLSPHWRKQVFYFPLAKGWGTFDCTKLKIDFKDTDRLKKLRKHANDRRVLVIGELADGALVELDEKQLQLRLPKTEAAVKIATIKKQNQAAWFTPSPDKRAAILSEFGKPMRLVVFDATGKVLGELLDSK
jgi:hypothetical protein